MSGPIIVGPGSQPAESDGAELDILQLPSGMETYLPPVLPEPEDVVDLTEALATLDALNQMLHTLDDDRQQRSLPVGQLDSENQELIDQVLGEGEVSALITLRDRSIRIQESVLAGVWRVQTRDQNDQLIADCIDVGAIPSVIETLAFADAHPRLELPEARPQGVINAPALFAEINEQCERFGPLSTTHVINLTLLPQTEQDLMFLDGQLGAGPVTILSRGYGNCRISSTNVRHVWWVQYFNSQDKNILNSLEITAIPSVACAAPEDLTDSAERLTEILEIYR